MATCDGFAFVILGGRRVLERCGLVDVVASVVLAVYGFGVAGCLRWVVVYLC